MTWKTWQNTQQSIPMPIDDLYFHTLVLETLQGSRYTSNSVTAAAAPKGEGGGERDRLGRLSVTYKKICR